MREHLDEARQTIAEQEFEAEHANTRGHDIDEISEGNLETQSGAE